MFTSAPKTTTLRDITPAELNDLLAAREITLVDVREPGEYAAARIEGAVNLPLSSFDPAELPPGDVVLQCGIGKRSAMAAQKCAEVGRAVTGHLAGGINAWAQAGLPISRG